MSNTSNFAPCFLDRIIKKRKKENVIGHALSSRKKWFFVIKFGSFFFFLPFLLHSYLFGNITDKVQLINDFMIGVTYYMQFFHCKESMTYIKILSEIKVRKLVFEFTKENQSRPLLFRFYRGSFFFFPFY